MDELSFNHDEKVTTFCPVLEDSRTFEEAEKYSEDISLYSPATTHSDCSTVSNSPVPLSFPATKHDRFLPENDMSTFVLGKRCNEARDSTWEKLKPPTILCPAPKRLHRPVPTRSGPSLSPWSTTSGFDFVPIDCFLPKHCVGIREEEDNAPPALSFGRTVVCAGSLLPETPAGSPCSQSSCASSLTAWSCATDTASLDDALLMFDLEL